MQFPYRKILIVGCGGAGKSTLAREMGQRFGLPVVHLDRLWWLPGWQERSREEFDTLLEAELSKPAWILDGNFSRTFARRLQSADLCIFLDYDPALCMESIYKRVEQYRDRSRPDMTPGCPERVDPEFETWVRNFATNVRPSMLSILENSPVPVQILRSREEATTWLNSFL